MPHSLSGFVLSLLLFGQRKYEKARQTVQPEGRFLFLFILFFFHILSLAVVLFVFLFRQSFGLGDTILESYKPILSPLRSVLSASRRFFLHWIVLETDSKTFLIKKTVNKQKRCCCPLISLPGVLLHHLGRCFWRNAGVEKQGARSGFFFELIPKADGKLVSFFFFPPPLICKRLTHSSFIKPNHTDLLDIFIF